MAVKTCYLASANTSAGFTSFFEYVLEDAQRVYIIKGGPGCGKSTFMKTIGEELLDKGLDVDIIYCSADKDSVDAVYIHGVEVAIVDGTAPHVIDPKYPGAVERLLDFGDYWDIDYLRNNKVPIKAYTDEIAESYKEFYKLMKNAKLIHDRWEAEYHKGMSFDKANEITDRLIKEIVKESIGGKGREKHRFAGALTPQGQVSFYENLTEGIKNRYIMKGRPGSGKSTMLKKLAKTAIEAGYDVEFYHCGFDPNSIDMLRIPKLSFAILDGTAPHVFDPAGDDKLIDMADCIDFNIVKENEEPIVSIQKEYAEEIAKVKKVYRKIKDLHDELEKYYIDATDFNDVNALRKRITNAIVEMIEE